MIAIAISSDLVIGWMQIPSFQSLRIGQLQTERSTMKPTIHSSLIISGLIAAITSISAIESALADPNQIRQVLQTRECAGCNLSREKLSFANLRGANLRNANLFSADLKLADLREANLIGAILDKADLRGADLTGADLTGAYMSETNLCGAIMPDGQKSVEGCPKAPK
ncbi:pentapeptide repeat-containing protein [Pseudanabaena biceps]|nr:pentapeptide repeat-containing protein [Pseudanabaena biceps]